MLIASMAHENGIKKSLTYSQSKKSKLSVTASRAASQPIFEKRSCTYFPKDQSFVALKVRPDGGMHRTQDEPRALQVLP
jgi:hypothetical protein